MSKLCLVPGISLGCNLERIFRQNREEVLARNSLHWSTCVRVPQQARTQALAPAGLGGEQCRAMKQEKRSHPCLCEDLDAWFQKWIPFVYKIWQEISWGKLRGMFLFQFPFAIFSRNYSHSWATWHIEKMSGWINKLIEIHTRDASSSFLMIWCIFNQNQNVNFIQTSEYRRKSYQLTFLHIHPCSYFTFLECLTLTMHCAGQ